MKTTKKIFMTLAFILIYVNYFVAYAECAPKSFVDKWIYSDLPFEEDPADEFITEKKEINKLCMVESEEDVVEGFHELNVKLQELKEKEIARYGEEYVDWNWAFVSNRLLAWNGELIFTTNFQRRLVGHTDSELKKILQDENIWKDFQTEFEQMNRKFSVPLELSFRMDQKFADFCKETLGETNPNTLRYTINLIQDYSLLGDSKTALEMEKDLLPKIKKIFGARSSEVAEVFSLMANDYKILGNYRKSEEMLLKAIAINKELHGGKSSPELVANLVALVRLTNATPNSDAVIALDKAAKNLLDDDLYSDDDLYRLGYFHVKILNSPIHDMERLVNLSQVCTREDELIKSYRRDSYTKFIDSLFEQSENAKALGLYKSALTWNLVAMADCKMNLGNYHHKTLVSLCNLSDDYLTLNQTSDALALAQEALATSKKIYGDSHPCTIYAIHSLTNIYRKQEKYSEALAEDLKAYELCKKIFVKCSATEPLETMRTLADIADNYKGLKNYPLAIKYYEEFLAKCTLNNAHTPKIAEVRKNLAYIYNVIGEYQKTIQLYDFLREEDNFYSLNGLPIDGLTAAHSADVLGDALANVGKNAETSYIYSQEIIKIERVRLINTFATIENKRKWFAQTVPYYKKAAKFFVTQNENMDAFKAVELCKGRTLADQYNDLLAMYKGGLNEDDILKLRALKERISRYREDFNREFNQGSDALKFNLRVAQLELMDDYDKYAKQLGEKYPKYDEALDSGRINTGVRSDLFFTPEQMKTLIPHDHCYISFSVAKKDEESNTQANEILFFVVNDKGEVKSFSVTVDDEFFEQCELYHDLNSYSNIREMNRFDHKYLWRIGDKYLINRDRDNAPVVGAEQIKAKDDEDGSKWRELRQKICVELSEKFMPTLEKLTGNSTHWIISPDAELNLVPFETLLYRDKMLVEAVDVSYVPSLVVMNLMKEAGDKNTKLVNRKELFAMGDAIYNADAKTAQDSQQDFFKLFRGTSLDNIDIKSLQALKWNKLKSAALELDKVSPLFTNKEVLRQEQVTEKNLWNLNRAGELSKYKYLLFSTHGLFVPDMPEYSSIVLSQNFNDKDFDGYVTVGEWLAYNLNSDLVYLSACESGRGDYQAGEGIIGIPYALTVAGNKDTVMSLWKVKDNGATAEFISVVFKKLRDGKSEVTALNETKREFLKQNDPSIWAAFLLYGI